jgi:uncharacterized membrane protein YhaH (DUF805 family)
MPLSETALGGPLLVFVQTSVTPLLVFGLWLCATGRSLRRSRWPAAVTVSLLVPAILDPYAYWLPLAMAICLLLCALTLAPRSRIR